MSLLTSYNLKIFAFSKTSTFEIIKSVTPEILIASINFLTFNQFTFLFLPVLTPYSKPMFPIKFNSSFSNKDSGNSGSIPTRVS